MFEKFKNLLISGSLNTKLLENIYAVIGRSNIENILSSEKYADPLRLERSGFKVYSQNDEDGIIQEIFNRIGTLNKSFIEFGVENGIENNTRYLLQKGWQGLWLEGNKKQITKIHNTFASFLERGVLNIKQTIVTRENINDSISGSSLPRELDLLCIDIDGNDLYVWDAITCVSPRVVVIEYNAKFPPPIKWAIDYDPQRVWDGTDYFGASLSSLTELAEKKGFCLVCCNITGTNAFFVRRDLVANKFQPPFTAENFYQPTRYYLSQALFTGLPVSGKHCTFIAEPINKVAPIGNQNCKDKPLDGAINEKT